MTPRKRRRHRLAAVALSSILLSDRARAYDGGNSAVCNPAVVSLGTMLGNSDTTDMASDDWCCAVSTTILLPDLLTHSLAYKFLTESLQASSPCYQCAANRLGIKEDGSPCWLDDDFPREDFTAGSSTCGCVVGSETELETSPRYTIWQAAMEDLESEAQTGDAGDAVVTTDSSETSNCGQSDKIMWPTENSRELAYMLACCHPGIGYDTKTLEGGTYAVTQGSEQAYWSCADRVFRTNAQSIITEQLDTNNQELTRAPINFC